jgi:aldose 1-epimerase
VAQSEGHAPAAAGGARRAPRLLELRSGDVRLALAPTVGGSIARLSSVRGAMEDHWLRPASDSALESANPLGMASFPLVPWCNRIRNGRADLGARPIRLRPNYQDSPHTIHGVGWQRPWEVASAHAREAHLVLEHEAGEWPYRFVAEQTFALGENVLDVALHVRNTDTAPMPLGIGHHPYLPHRDGTRLTADVERMWSSDAEAMPTGLERPSFLDEMRRGILLSDLDLDNNFTGWTRRATVDWPREGMRVVLEADPPLDFFVVYCPRVYDFFCMEPVSNCTDWLNLRDRPDSERGGTMLAPGASLQAGFRLRLEWT